MLPKNMVLTSKDGEAKAVYKIDGIALVNCEIFEKFLETFREY